MNWVERKHRNAAHRRFTKLVHTRVKGYMADALGKHWATFARAATATGKPMFAKAFTPGNVWCRGPLAGGGSCPHGHGSTVAADQMLALEQIEYPWLGFEARNYLLGEKKKTLTTSIASD